MDKLETYECNILKRCNELSTRSRSTALVYAMGISKLSVAILKRRLNFVIQLMTNELTRELMTRSRCYTLEKLLYDLGYEHDNTSLIINVQELYEKCKNKLSSISQTEKALLAHPLTKCVSHLLSNRSWVNDGTLQFLLDPRRVWSNG